MCTSSFLQPARMVVSPATCRLYAAADTPRLLALIQRPAAEMDFAGLAIDAGFLVCTCEARKGGGMANPHPQHQVPALSIHCHRRNPHARRKLQRITHPRGFRIPKHHPPSPIYPR